MQTAVVLTHPGMIQVQLPHPDQPLMDDVRWGALDAFPTPAYWHYQVVSRRLAGRPAAYRLGRSLTEEVGACLLGGHGIPATVGLAAYNALRERGAFSGKVHSQETLEAWLREPITVGDRKVSYRFAAQKAKYLAAALPKLKDTPTFTSGKALRDWLTELPGIGLKTASWVARNWLDADDVAILDIHIMRLGQVVGLFPREFTVERHYLQLEDLFLRFSEALGVRASELDTVMWHEMATSPAVAGFVMDQLDGVQPTRLRARAQGKQASTQHQAQLTLV
jgi:thermostable 8-oxoguanine DNA glycosylase